MTDSFVFVFGFVEFCFLTLIDFISTTVIISFSILLACFDNSLITIFLSISCSFNCAKAYNLEHYDNKAEEKNCLLLSLNKRLTNDDSFIKPANPRHSLKMFGGHQTIEVFRKDFKILAKNSILIYPPSKPLKLYVEEEYKHKIVRFHQNTDYKVKRTKPLARTANSLHNLLKTKD